MQQSDEQQDVLVVSGDGEPLRRIESYIRENIGENHIFRVDSLKEAAAVMQRTDLEILVADRGRILREGKDISWEDSFEPTRGNAKEDIRYVLLYIREHYAEDLSLARIAGWICLTPNYLCTLFKRTAGVSLNTYIERIRMEKAAFFLITEDIRLQDLARRVGYRHSSYFCRCFRKFYGMTPNQFRNSYRARRK